MTWDFLKTHCLGSENPNFREKTPKDGRRYYWMVRKLISFEIKRKGFEELNKTQIFNFGTEFI